MPPSSSIQVANLRFSYGRGDVLHDLSFEVRPGEVTGLLGPNGAGKSTLLRILAGIIEPGGGSVVVNGFSLPDQSFLLKQTLGYVPEAAELYETLTAGEFLELCGRLHGLDEDVVQARLEVLLDGFGLLDERHQRLGAYSKGMRQKVLIAAALLHNPSLVILDEPLTGLDVDSAALVKHLLRSLASQGRTVLYSSHVLDVVERVCARVLILVKGAIIADGSPDELKARADERSLEEVFRQVTQAADTTPRVTKMLGAIDGVGL
jgi:ABC-2 type transport system ATP-binding protein